MEVNSGELRLRICSKCDNITNRSYWETGDFRDYDIVVGIKDDNNWNLDGIIAKHSDIDSDEIYNGAAICTLCKEPLRTLDDFDMVLHITPN